jgi:hypothetical protein
VWVSDEINEKCIAANEVESCAYFIREEDCVVDMKENKCTWIKEGDSNKSYCVAIGQSNSCTFYNSEEICTMDINDKICVWINRSEGDDLGYIIC